MSTTEDRRSDANGAASDLHGNGWLLQEVTTRLPGRIDAAETVFASTADLASAFRRAEAALAGQPTRAQP